MKKIEKKINDQIISPFSNVKDWTDLIQILKSLQSLIKQIKKTDDNSIILSNLNCHIPLSKCLSQCLKPIVPSGVHKEAIDTYNLLLNKILEENKDSLGLNLGLYSSGLFPFFEIASTNNKIDFLKKIIKKIFLKLNKTEIEICLPGFFAGILPGYEEQNEDLKRNIKECFEKIKEKLKLEIFYGSLWSIILRNPHLRKVGMRYLLDNIPQFKEYLNLEEETKREYFIKTYYPKIDTLVLNTLCAVIEDKDIQTVRVGMDFIILRLPLIVQNTILSNENKVILIGSALNLFERNEYSTTRRLSQWLMFGQSPEEKTIDFKNNDTKNIIDLLIKALKYIFKQTESESEDNCMNIKKNICILEQLLNQQESLIKVILNKVAFDLVNSVVNYWMVNLNQREFVQKDEVIKKIKSFFNTKSIFTDCLWKSLGEHLMNYNNKENVSNDDKFNKLTNSLKFCLLYICLSSNENKIEFYIPIITNLLDIMTKIEINDNREGLKKLRDIIFLTLVFTKALQQDMQSNKKEKRNYNKKEEKKEINKDIDNILLNQSISITMLQENNNKFSTIPDIQQKYKIDLKSSMFHIRSNENYIEKNTQQIFHLTQSVLIYQKYYITIVNQLLKYENFTRGEIKMFNQATELLIRTQEYSKQNKVPEWVFYLEKLIFKGKTKISLQASNHIIDLMIINMQNEIYNIISNHLINKEIDLSCIEQQYLYSLIKATNAKKTCAELLMSHLWLLLFQQQHQQEIIELLKKFSNAKNDSFINIISNSFSEENYESSVIGIKQFSQFWKLTNEFYPKEVLFGMEKCIFKMIEFLDHEHPMVRHLSKSWLNQSVLVNYSKILDPIFKEIFTEDKSWKLSKEKKMFIIKEYDYRKIIAAFRMMKNIIINTKDSGVTYRESRISAELLYLDEFGTLINKELNNPIPRRNYLELMVNVSLRFIQVKMSKKINKDFTKENYAVNAASCEFLEYLLSFIDSKSFLIEIASFITHSLLEILNGALNGKDEVIEVQVLNLLKVLLISTKNEHKKNKDKVKELFTYDLLIGSLERGIKENYFFVRGYFISFIESMFPLLNNILPHKDITTIAIKLITTITQLLKDRVVYNQMDIEDILLFSHWDNEHCDFIYKNYLEEYREYKTYDENEIISILKGIKGIIFNYLEIASPSTSDKENWNEKKKNIQKILKESTTGGGFFSAFFGSGSDDNTNKPENSHIVNLEKQIDDIILSMINVWINESEKYVQYDYCLNDVSILAYKKDIIENNIEKKNGEKDNEIKVLIVEIMYNIFIQDPIKCMTHLLHMWYDDKKIIQDKQYKLSLIEILIGMKIPMEIFLTVIKAIIQLSSNEKYVKGKKNIFLSIYKQSVTEGKIFHFIYSYIALINSINNNDSNQIWSEMIEIITILNDKSKESNTFCWLIEIINLMLIKIPILNESIKKDLSYNYYCINKKLIDISFYDKFDSIYENAEFITLPVLPSIYSNVISEKFKQYDLYKKNNMSIDSESQKKFPLNSEESDSKDQKLLDPTEAMLDSLFQSTSQSINKNFIEISNPNNTNNYKVNDFYLKYYNFIISKQKLSTNALNDTYRKIAFLTLKNTFTSIVISLFYDNQKEIFRLYSNLIENLILLMKLDILSSNKTFYTELAIEFLHNLMIKDSSNTSQCGKDLIMEFFLNESFFITNAKMISFWKDIINGLVQRYSGDIISELINSINTGFLFFKSSDSSRRNILRKLSFVIYSCEKDKFSKNLNIIKDKVKELLTEYNENSILESEIFLMMRVLFLRFSHEHIMEMLKILWPIIFSELVSIIEKKKKNESMLLILESFKFIELLSLANVEEFSLYQWIFIVDTFDMKRLDTKDKESLLSSILENEKKVFKPVALNIANNWDCNERMLKGQNREKNQLIIVRKEEKGNKLEEKELIELIKRFFYSIGDMNSYRVKVNYKQIEEIVERDFLSLA